jgi:nucleoside-diphosphate-sugar epimerase
MTRATVLITGVSGFIARHCAVEMLNAGYGVRGTVRALSRAGGVRDSLARQADVTRLEFAEADLEADAGWTEAVRGCAHVLHVASPFPLAQPRDEQQLIRPAVDGTLRVLHAAVAAGVERFVQTSSMVAIMYGHPADRTTPFTEDDWTQLDQPGVTAYAKSKTLAERAARDWLERERPALHYSTVNPGVVFGPALDRDIGTSADFIRMMLKGKYPGAPRIAIPVVDVRDVARLHRLAVEADAPSGGRYLAVAGCPWLVDVGRAIRERLGPEARRVPVRVLPDFTVRLAALFDPTARLTVPELGKPLSVDTTHTRRTLGFEFIAPDEAACAMARSLLDLGLA